jgi:multidrug transporter EmrE-like cation transporter
MRDAATWSKLMSIAFVANGLGPFGLKILTAMGLSAQQSKYLFWWYAGGALFAAAAFATGWRHVQAKELALGATMGLCSLGGQSFTGLSLAHGMPGHIVFPVTTGGSLFFVAAAGIVFFKERVGPYGLAGICLGICSLVLLSIS